MRSGDAGSLEQIASRGRAEWPKAKAAEVSVAVPALSALAR